MTAKVMNGLDVVTSFAFGAFKKVVGLVIVTSILTALFTVIIMFIGFKVV